MIETILVGIATLWIIRLEIVVRMLDKRISDIAVIADDELKNITGRVDDIQGITEEEEIIG